MTAHTQAQTETQAHTQAHAQAHTHHTPAHTEKPTEKHTEKQKTSHKTTKAAEKVTEKAAAKEAEVVDRKEVAALFNAVPPPVDTEISLVTVEGEMPAGATPVANPFASSSCSKQKTCHGCMSNDNCLYCYRPKRLCFDKQEIMDVDCYDYALTEVSCDINDIPEDGALGRMQAPLMLFAIAVLAMFGLLRH